MEEEIFKKMAKALNSALLDGFRGWLVNKDGEIIRIEVPYNEFHPQVAYKELIKDPNYKYTSGIGQDCVVDFLNLKGATYITKITIDKEKKEFQWTAGYLKERYDQDIQISGKMVKQSDILCNIITGLGYTAEEYRFTGEKNRSGVPLVDIKTIKPNTIKRTLKATPTRKIQPGDRIIFDKFNNPIAVESLGKRHSINNYPELYSGKTREVFKANFKKKDLDFYR